MKTLRMLTLLFLVGMGCVGAKAQIGYQVSLLNSATGEARANEKVTVSISLSNSEGGVFYNETKQATTNDFGVLNLTIGNKDTFEDVDFSKLPFFISVTVNGVLIGRTQVLAVPVAEAAKRVVPIDKDKIVGTWTYEYAGGGAIDRFTYTLADNGTGKYKYEQIIYGNISKTKEYNFVYAIEGNLVYCLGERAEAFYYYEGCLYKISGEKYTK